MVDEPGKTAPRSRLADIADQTVISTGRTASVGEQEPLRPAVEAAGPPGAESVFEEGDSRAQARRRWFLARLGEFRRSQVLLPLGASPGSSGAEAPLTVDVGGVRWILAFTGEAALARFAVARGEGRREWRYRGVWGAALLDAAVPTVAGTGVPCGVVVNAADGERGLVLPPVVGVVPEEVAVDGPGSFGSRSGSAAGPGGEFAAGAGHGETRLEEGR